MQSGKVSEPLRMRGVHRALWTDAESVQTEGCSVVLKTFNDYLLLANLQLYLNMPARQKKERFQ